VDPERFDTIVDELAAGRLDAEVPPHGTLSRVRRSVGLQGGPVSAPPAPPADLNTAATTAAGASLDGGRPRREGRESSS
jgi:hypothetical protein